MFFIWYLFFVFWLLITSVIVSSHLNQNYLASNQKPTIREYNQYTDSSQQFIYPLLNIFILELKGFKSKYFSIKENLPSCNDFNFKCILGLYYHHFQWTRWYHLCVFWIFSLEPWYYWSNCLKLYRKLYLRCHPDNNSYPFPSKLIKILNQAKRYTEIFIIYWQSIHWKLYHLKL